LSSRIENYLGFPTGISGQELAGRAYTQAQKFGAQVLIANEAKGLACDRKPHAIETDGGQRIPGRVVIIATGARYRRLDLENLSQFEGAGVYYGATFLEAQVCRGEDVIVVGGGNAAGQAAVYLAQSAKHVYMLVRADGLSESMSRYLIRRIEGNDAITLLTRTEIVALKGDNHVEEVVWRDNRNGATETHQIRHVFAMTGAVPNTQWLGGCVTVDANGFIKTGSDLSREDLAAASWPLARQPHLFETSRPGVFAVGDVRGGNMKRAAAAVGEGATAVYFAHQVLAE
jgi:thioredoxin reductase (NADPH)